MMLDRFYKDVRSGGKKEFSFAQCVCVGKKESFESLCDRYHPSMEQRWGTVLSTTTTRTTTDSTIAP